MLEEYRNVILMGQEYIAKADSKLEEAINHSDLFVAIYRTDLGEPNQLIIGLSFKIRTCLDLDAVYKLMTDSYDKVLQAIVDLRPEEIDEFEAYRLVRSIVGFSINFRAKNFNIKWISEYIEKSLRKMEETFNA